MKTQQPQKKGAAPPKKTLAAPKKPPPKPAATGTTTAATTAAAKKTPPSAQPSKPQSKEEVVNVSGESAQATTQVKKAVPATKTVVKKKIVKVVKKTAKPAQPVLKSNTKQEEDLSSASNPSPKKEEEVPVSKVDEGLKKEESIGEDVVDLVKVEEEPDVEMEEKEPKTDLPSADMVEDSEEVGDDKDVQGDEVEKMAGEGVEDLDQEEVAEEAGDEGHGEDDASEPDEEAEGLENMEISAFASERKIKMAQEIFIGGLDRDAVEDDVRKAFENIGEILEVRMQTNPSTKKNKGYAFVKFADKEQAARALSELKNPVIRGKACGTAPSEDKHTLFLGNICNTWTKEAIKNKLKEYGVGGVENITLVPDARQEGFSKGFAFLEYPDHANAMLAYKRLQKPDVLFGHAERTAKVAFAEPLRDPDPEVMAQVRSVFVDGLPPYWDEERVKEHFKVYGEIEGTMLARNKVSSKRKDFGFVDFTTHEAAVACVAGVNNTELGDDKRKAKVKVRLSNPLPKTQAVKGGIRGGFRISRPGTISRFGRGSGRGERPFNKNYQRGKGYARGQPERFASAAAGRRPGKDFGSNAPATRRPDVSRPRQGARGRGRVQSILDRRQPLVSRGDRGEPFGRRHLVDEPYLYNDRVHGIKRPYSMVEEEPAYMELSRLRRLHQPREFNYEDTIGAPTGVYSHDYYGSDYGHSAYSSTYGRDHSFSRGYY